MGFYNEVVLSLPHLSNLYLLEVQDLVCVGRVQGVRQVLRAEARGVTSPITSEVQGLVTELVH